MKKFLLTFFLLLLIFGSPCYSSLPRATGPNGIEIKMLPNDANKCGIYMFEISGFSPGEKITMISDSNNEVLWGEFIMPAPGPQMMTSAPWVEGHKKGDAYITLIGEKGDRVSLSYQWEMK